MKNKQIMLTKKKDFQVFIKVNDNTCI